MSGAIEKVFVIFDVARHPKMQKYVMPIVQVCKKVFPPAVRACKAAAL